MKKIEFTRFIERYLENKMEPSEKRWFEKELEGNIWLRKEMKLRRKADEIVSNFDAIKLREKLMQAESRHRKTSTIEKAVRKVPVNYAAIFMGLIIISSLLVLTGNRFDLVDYTADKVNKYEVESPQRSGSQQIHENVVSGLQFYNEGNFQKANVEFNKVPLEAEGAIRAAYYSGLSSMQQKKYQEAIESFELFVCNNDNLFYSDAIYYLGLCYYNIDDMANARTTLEGILITDSKHKKDAKKLLRKIK